MPLGARCWRHSNGSLTALCNTLYPAVCLLNYQKNGDMFWNQFFVAALRDKFGQIVNYVGVQVPSVPTALPAARPPRGRAGAATAGR